MKDKWVKIYLTSQINLEHNGTIKNIKKGLWEIFNDLSIINSIIRIMKL